jgi:hypothetical protein
MRRPPTVPLLLVALGMVASAALFATLLAWLKPAGLRRFALCVASAVPGQPVFPDGLDGAAAARRLLRSPLPMGEEHWKKSLPVQLALGVLLSLTHLVLVELAMPIAPGAAAGRVRRAQLLEHGERSRSRQPPVVDGALLDALRARLRPRVLPRLSGAEPARLAPGTQLTRARLQALEAQLAPHFLFNTLNSISSLVDHDAPAARKMIVGSATCCATPCRAGSARR